MKMFYICIIQYSNSSHMWLANTWHVVIVTEKMNFFTSVHLNSFKF